MISVKKTFILVNSGKETLHVPTNSKGNIDVNMLREVFPGAIGLTFKVGNENRLIEKVDLELKPPESGWGGTQYTVFPTTNNNSGESASVDKIKKLMLAIRDQKQSSKPIKGAVEPHKKRAKKHSRTVKLHVGWLHKAGEKYTQMKKPQGGIKIVEVKDTDCITVPETIQLIKDSFFAGGSTSNHCYTEDNLIFNLGTLDGTNIEFKDKSGEPCDLFEYLKCQGYMPSKFTFYLLTMFKQECEPHKGNRDTTLTSSKGTTKNNVFGLPPVAPASEMLQAFNVEYLKLKTSSYSGQISCRRYIGEQSCIESITLENPEIERAKFDSVLAYGFLITNINSNGDIFLDIEFDNDKLLFEFKFPKAGEVLIPHSIVYDISELIGLYNGQLGLSFISSCTDKCNPIYTWYLDGNILFEEKMMYFINVLSDGEYVCKIKCSGGEITSSAITITDHFENIIQVAPIQIKYGSSSKLQGRNIRKESIFHFSTVGCSSPTDSGLGSTERPKLLHKLEDNIGCGSQAKVVAGTWLGTEVAIKSIKTGNKNIQRDLALREISIHSKIRHPNIVQIMCCSFTSSTIHIVMERIYGDCIYNIIFDDDVKESFQLDDKKRALIALQLCQAVNYLHKQHVPIVHRDLKSSNVLVTPVTLTTKLCDLGLSKINCLSQATQTVAGNLKGTPMYMAPELFLEKKQATTKCDIWSLACTLYELFTESEVWELDEDFNKCLEMKLTNKLSPDLTKLPTTLQEIILQSLCYTPDKRPDVLELVLLFKKLH